MSGNFASENELLEAIKTMLMRSGHLSKVKAEIRANITELLQQRNEAFSNDPKVRPPPPNEEVSLVNNLIREYLEWNGYLYTSSVLISEAAMPQEKPLREKLCESLGVRDDEKSTTLPLLTNIVAAYTERIKRKMNKTKMEMNNVIEKKDVVKA